MITSAVAEGARDLPALSPADEMHHFHLPPGYPVEPGPPNRSCRIPLRSTGMPTAVFGSSSIRNTCAISRTLNRTWSRSA